MQGAFDYDLGKEEKLKDVSFDFRVRVTDGGKGIVGAYTGSGSQKTAFRGLIGYWGFENAAKADGFAEQTGKS